MIATNQWFEKPVSTTELAKKLKPYFPDRSEKSIISYLHVFGLYRSSQSAHKTMEKLTEEKLWDYVGREMKKLQKEWAGPDPSVFLLPCDLNNSKIQREHGGKSGLAFYDKLFLFLSPGVPRDELKGLLIHEYHHICRIAKLKKKEKDYTLTDVVIMEGLAENAVREMLGEGKTAKWTRMYKEPQLKQFWKRHIVPNGKIKQDHRDFDKLMYGLGMYPNMLGYTAGYYAVETYMKKTGADTKALFTLPADQIIEKIKLG